jgi:pimeloyl-ACP methyl ester carboxylesterase
MQENRIVEVAIDRVAGLRAERAIAFLHGILGRGRNLRALATRFVEARPRWEAWLVDLRGHGQSPKATPGPSVEAVARDILHLTKRAELPLRAIVGHSFGGKVALEAARIGAPTPLEHVVTIDSLPGSRKSLRGGDSALAVIGAIESLPRSFRSKMDFVRSLIATGQPRAIAEWLAGSVEKENSHVRFMLHLDEIRALILDYLARDLWPVVENPPGAVAIHLIIADESPSYSADDREVALRIAASNPQVTADILSGGHWLHVDNPDGLLRKLLGYIRE